MKQYIINYWECGNKYSMVIGSTSYDGLRDMLKNSYDRFTMEEISDDKI
jgi:hypothetical protein